MIESHTLVLFAAHPPGSCCLEKGLGVLSSPCVPDSRHLFFAVPSLVLHPTGSCSPWLCTLTSSETAVTIVDTCCQTLALGSPSSAVSSSYGSQGCHPSSWSSDSVAGIPRTLERAKPSLEDQEQETSGTPRTRALLGVPG